jgi:hypothetical protein
MTVRILPDLLAPEECETLLQRAIATGFSPARLAGLGRDNDESFVIDEALANSLKQRLRAIVPLVEIDDLFEVYRYRSGQSVAEHSDGARAIRGRQRSNATVLTYLSDSFQGGRTRFPGEWLALAPPRGHAVLFSHGVLHSAEIVAAGTKYVARSDVLMIDQ